MAGVGNICLVTQKTIPPADPIKDPVSIPIITPQVSHLLPRVNVPLHILHIHIREILIQSKMIHMTSATTMIQMILQMTGQMNLVMVIMTVDMMMLMITGNQITKIKTLW